MKKFFSKKKNEQTRPIISTTVEPDSSSTSLSSLSSTSSHLSGAARASGSKSSGAIHKQQPIKKPFNLIEELPNSCVVDYTLRNENFSKKLYNDYQLYNQHQRELVRGSRRIKFRRCLSVYLQGKQNFIRYSGVYFDWIISCRNNSDIYMLPYWKMGACELKYCFIPTVILFYNMHLTHFFTIGTHPEFNYPVDSDCNRVFHFKIPDNNFEMEKAEEENEKKENFHLEILVYEYIFDLLKHTRFLITKMMQINLNSLLPIQHKRNQNGEWQNREHGSKHTIIRLISGKNNLICVHRSVLEASSYVFRRYLRDGIKNLNVPDENVIHTIVNFLYSGECILTPDNVINVLKTANMWSILPLKFFCCNFIVMHVSQLSLDEETLHQYLNCFEMSIYINVLDDLKSPCILYFDK